MARDRKDLGARKFVRVDLRKKGFLIPAPDAPWIECYILDISENGACLDVGDLAVPKMFGLSLTAGGEVRRVCALIWRRGEMVGVRFISARELRKGAAPAGAAGCRFQKGARLEHPSTELNHARRSSCCLSIISAQTRTRLRGECALTLLIGVLQRLRNQANPEYRLPGFIQQFHLPLGVFGKFSGNVCDHVPADAGHFLPGGVMIGKLRAVVVDACVLAMSNAEEEDRHGN